MSSYFKKASKKGTKVAKSLGGSNSKRKATSTSSLSTTPSVNNYKIELNYPKGYDQKLHDYAEEVEREIQIEEEEEQEEEPTTPIEIHRSRQSSTRSYEKQLQQKQQQQQQQRQARDENEPVRQPFPAMPPPSGRAVSHVWSYFTKEPTDNLDVFLCTCQIYESQGVNPLVSYNFSRGGGTRFFNKHLAKKHGITKETHVASGSGTISGSRQWDIPS
ncbi:RNA polymerase II degradation factor 1-like [Amaranthus tricolor]|uniref:RNA polymerase II degradation factor 1-like n=1 Tax=Amaranthus tricolor TaxID=29722 RepID=UPI0025891DEF|nr:RNA polymerase II degradation factor 1-like [Amaranthus tricolor]